MNDRPLLFGSKGFHDLLEMLMRCDAYLHPALIEKGGEGPAFGKRQRTPVREEDALKIARLSMLRRELVALVDDPMSGKQMPFRLVTAPVPLLKIGEMATIMIDPKTGLYSLREEGLATNAMITASEERLMDYVMCLLAAGANRHAPFTPDFMARLMAGQKLEDVERRIVMHTLRQFHGNRLQAADALGLSLPELRERLRRYFREESEEQRT